METQLQAMSKKTTKNKKTTKPVFIFDFDGTLVDSISTIVDALVKSAKENKAELCPNEARQVIGLGLPQASKCLFPEATNDFLHHLKQQIAMGFVPENGKLSL